MKMTPADETYFSATTAKNTVLVGIFLIFAFDSLAIRDTEILRFVLEGKLVRFSDGSQKAELCGYLPACLRVGSAWLSVGIQNLLIELSRLIDLPADRHNPELLSIAGKESFLFVMGEVISRLVVLTPIFLGASMLYRSFALRALLIISVFMTLSGWARSNPLFTEQFFVYYDFAAVGFVFLLFFLIATEKTKGFFGAAATLVLGQLIFENLGIVAGIAIAIYSFAGSDHSLGLSARTAMAMKRLLAMAAVSIVALGVLYLAMQIANDWEQIEGSSFSGYFTIAWNEYGRANFADFHDIKENFFEIIAYPSASGLLLGLLVIPRALSTPEAMQRFQTQFHAALGIWIGFMCTLVIAMFLSGLYYEMGRQLIPLCVVTTLVWATGIPVLANTIRNLKAR